MKKLRLPHRLAQGYDTFDPAGFHPLRRLNITTFVSRAHKTEDGHLGLQIAAGFFFLTESEKRHSLVAIPVENAKKGAASCFFAKRLWRNWFFDARLPTRGAPVVFLLAK